MIYYQIDKDLKKYYNFNYKFYNYKCQITNIYNAKIKISTTNTEI